jgi:hypothetical protein
MHHEIIVEGKNPGEKVKIVVFVETKGEDCSHGVLIKIKERDTPNYIDPIHKHDYRQREGKHFLLQGKTPPFNFDYWVDSAHIRRAYDELIEKMRPKNLGKSSQLGVTITN